MKDYKKRAAVGLITFSTHGYNSTRHSFLHRINMVTPVFEGTSHRTVGSHAAIEVDIHNEPESHLCYSKYVCSESKKYECQVEHKHDSYWNAEVRLSIACETLDIFKSMAESVLTQDQYYEALYYLYENHITKYLTKADLVSFNERKFRMRNAKDNYTTDPTRLGWVSLLTACAKRNSRPEWVRSSSGDIFAV